MNWFICVIIFLVIFYITVVVSNKLIQIIIKNRFEQSSHEKGIDKETTAQPQRSILS